MLPDATVKIQIFLIFIVCAPIFTHLFDCGILACILSTKLFFSKNKNDFQSSILWRWHSASNIMNFGFSKSIFYVKNHPNLLETFFIKKYEFKSTFRCRNLFVKFNFPQKRVETGGPPGWKFGSVSFGRTSLVLLVVQVNLFQKQNMLCTKIVLNVKTNKIKGTPILKLAMVKRLYVKKFVKTIIP